MPSRELQVILEAWQNRFALVWANFTVTMALFLPIAWFRLDMAGRTAMPDGRLLLTTGLASGLAGALALLLHRTLFSDRRLRNALNRAPEMQKLALDPRTGRLDPALLARLAALSPTEKRLLNLHRLCTTGYFPGWSLHNVIVLSGVLLAFSRNAFILFLPWLVMGLILNVASYPRLRQLAERSLRLDAPR